MRRLLSFLIGLFVFTTAAAQTTAPGVTAIGAVNINGQTFVNWADPNCTYGTACGSSTMSANAAFRFQLVRATGSGCPITGSNLSSATIVQTQVLNNSGQAIYEMPYFTYTEANRTDPTKTMLTVAGLNGSTTSSLVPLAAGTGLASYTNQSGDTSPACYAVLTCDAGAIQPLTGPQTVCSGPTYTQSSISAGNNSMTGTVSEAMGNYPPMIVLPGSTVGRYPAFAPRCGGGNSPSTWYADSSYASNTTCSCTYGSPFCPVGKAMWIHFDGSGGHEDASGDMWAYFYDPTMNFADGNGIFQARSDGAAGGGGFSGMTTGVNNGIFGYELLSSVQEPIWAYPVTSSGMSGVETLWHGLLGNPLLNSTLNNPTYGYTWKTNSLTHFFPWIPQHYAVDTNHIYATTTSMGGHIFGSWIIRQNPQVFDAVFMRVPGVGPWLILDPVAGGGQTGTTAPITAASETGYVATFTSTLGPPTNMNLTISGMTPSGYNGTCEVLTSGGSGFTCQLGVSGLGPGTGFGTASFTLPSGQPISTTDDPVAYLQANGCGTAIPFVAWALGRQDASLANSLMWGSTAALANELQNCHYGVALLFNNGTHGTGAQAFCPPWKTSTCLINQYYPQLSLNRSYPAFDHWALDDNLGCNSTSYVTCEAETGNGDCASATYVDPSGVPGLGQSCFLNYGWEWSNVSDTSTSWSATITNSYPSWSPSSTYALDGKVQYGGLWYESLQANNTNNEPDKNPTWWTSISGTVNITPRNTQQFKPSVGSLVLWTANSTQHGKAKVDAYGLVTAAGVLIGTGNNTITFTLTHAR